MIFETSSEVVNIERTCNTTPFERNRLHLYIFIFFWRRRNLEFALFFFSRERSGIGLFFCQTRRDALRYTVFLTTQCLERASDQSRTVFFTTLRDPPRLFRKWEGVKIFLKNLYEIRQSC